MSHVAALVPMYNEGLIVGAVVSSLRERFDLVVCVDDGSADDSAQAARASGATVLRHPVNLGQGAALRTGFEYLAARAGIEHVVTFDADGQHDPDDAVAMVATARASGVDAVLGTRGEARPQGQTWSRRLLLRLALRLSRATTGLALTDTHNGLRVLHARILPTLALRQRGMAYASELESLIARREMSWVEHPVTITYSRYSRGKGQRNLNALNIVFDLIAARMLPS